MIGCDLGFGIIDGKDNLISWHAVKPGRLYATCYGSTIHWTTYQWTRIT